MDKTSRPRLLPWWQAVLIVTSLLGVMELLDGPTEADALDLERTIDPRPSPAGDGGACSDGVARASVARTTVAEST